MCVCVCICVCVCVYVCVCLCVCVCVIWIASYWTVTTTVLVWYVLKASITVVPVLLSHLAHLAH